MVMGGGQTGCDALAYTFWRRLRWLPTVDVLPPVPL